MLAYLVLGREKALILRLLEFLQDNLIQFIRAFLMDIQILPETVPIHCSPARIGVGKFHLSGQHRYFARVIHRRLNLAFAKTTAHF